MTETLTTRTGIFADADRRFAAYAAHELRAEIAAEFPRWALLSQVDDARGSR